MTGMDSEMAEVLALEEQASAFEVRERETVAADVPSHSLSIL